MIIWDNRCTQHAVIDDVAHGENASSTASPIAGDTPV